MGAKEQDPAELAARWGRGQHVRFEERFGGTVGVLSAADSAAVVSLQGAQVLSYVPRDGREALWMSPTPRLGTGKAVRGGIPVCWPWFGPHTNDARKPAHGFVRANPWEIVAAAGDDTGATLRLAFDATRIETALWPHQAVAEIEITLGTALRVKLTTENTGQTPFALTEALHTYLAIGDIAAVAIEGLAGCPYIDQLQPGRGLFQQHGMLAVAEEVDRIYQDCTMAVSVTDAVLARRITLTKEGSRSTVVWNPWVEKSRRLGDMGENGYRRMVCIEAANAGSDVVTLAPGARHHLVSEISVTDL